ncbi:MAG: hypothetical protein IPK68_23585 [Bdellovibrionales bacterium]|nr:hypothetical protein [Bdellovibrionales bacterium]
MRVLVLLRPRIAVGHLVAPVGSLAKDQSRQLSATGGPPDLSPVVGRVAVAMLVRHPAGVRALRRVLPSAEESQTLVTETEVSAQVRAIDAMFVPIRLEIRGPARPLAMWDLLAVMRVQPKSTSALRRVPVDSQTIRIRLQGRPAVRFRVRLARPTVVVFMWTLLLIYLSHILRPGMSLFEKFQIDFVLSCLVLSCLVL